MAWNQPGVMPGGLSSDSYLARHVRSLDSEHYSAAGMLPYRKAADGSMELLFALERPWNSFSKNYDPLGWNIFGGKRIPREERASEATAVRSFSEAVGQASGAPASDVMFRLIANSFAVWYALGKFILLVVEVTDNDLGADFPDKFAEYKQAQGSEEFTMLPSGYKKWSKQIDGVEWVKAADLLGGQPKKDVSDLLNNILQINGFTDFLEGKTDASALPDNDPGQGAPRQQEPWRGGGKGKGNSWQSNEGNGWQPKGKSYGNGKGKSDGKGKGWKGGGGKGMPMMQMMDQGYNQQPQPPAYAMPPMAYPQFDQNSVEMTRQLYGEQLYLNVLSLSPSPFIAQKITGMLLELPQNELMLNLTNQEELGRRVAEALDVLKEDGVF